jgi:uncharacterized membrane protein YidH (DUF202 family)
VSELDSGPVGYERDPGLAAERTELAWGRSALSLIACGAAVLRGAEAVTGDDKQPVVGIAMLAFGGLVWLSGVPLARRRAKAAATGTRTPARQHELVPLAFGTALVGAAGLIIAAVFTG